MKKKYIMITGASSGLGRELSIEASKKGYGLVLIGRDENRLHETNLQTECPEENIEIVFELLDFDNYRNLFKTIKDKNIILSGLVHCAGITKITPLRTISVKGQKEIFDIHYFAFVELIKWYNKKGISDGGSIVAISAINAHVPQKCMTAYAAAKSAVEAACRTLAAEEIEKNIRINSVVVGAIQTEMSDKVSDTLSGLETVNRKKGGDDDSRYLNPVSRQLIKPKGPKAIVGTILFLLGDDSSYITGREMYVDGGLLG